MYQSLERQGKGSKWVDSYGFRKTLQKHLDYADIGRILYGKWGAGIIKLLLVFTQCGFCVNYHIFLGNTLYGIIYPHEASSPLAFNSSIMTHNETFNSTDRTKLAQSMFSQIVAQSLKDVSNFSAIRPEWDRQPGAEHWKPSLFLLVLSPLPLFVIFVLLRKVREIGVISLIANSAATAAYFMVITYIIVGEYCHDQTPLVQINILSQYCIATGAIFNSTH